MPSFSHILSVYSADTAGVCSMLYELGGMVVVHDASGCNSTYATHDEPRWQHLPSNIFISALTEQDAILGNDERFITDVCQTALSLHPRFIAICGAPIPMMIGTDFDALAFEIEGRTGIPTLPMHTSGMQPYLKGAEEALQVLCRRFCRDDVGRQEGVTGVNILGATPLDLPHPEAMPRMKAWLDRNGLQLNAGMALGGCTLDDIAMAGRAAVNLVVSSAGLAAARDLEQRFGQPYVIGVPYGQRFASRLAAALHEAAAGNGGGVCPADALRHPLPSDAEDCGMGRAGVVGEAVNASSLAAALQDDDGIPARVLAPLGLPVGVAAAGDCVIADEDSARREFSRCGALYADPMYLPLWDGSRPFFAVPSYAFSGRCYRRHFPQLIDTPPDLEIMGRHGDYTTAF